MGLLRSLASGADVVLKSRCLVGRSPGSDLRLAGRGVSSEHATIYWDGERWILRDLTSRNGTRVSARVLFGSEYPLTAGDTIIFGDPAERFSVVDVEQPHPHAVREDGAIVMGQSGLLSLPNAENPVASVYTGDQSWEMEYRGAVTPVNDGETVELAGHRFRLVLPGVHPSMVNRTESVLIHRCVAASHMFFHVSRDEEFVAVEIEVGHVKKELSTRAFHYMLFFLARARQRDQEDGVSVDEAGWLYADDAVQGLRTSLENLNVDICRARQQLAKMKVVDDPEALVQRRRGTSQIRLGVPTITIDNSFSAPPSPPRLTPAT